MNPFKRFYEYFTAKSGKQRVLFVIAALLIAVFAFFFIKGNFFDNKKVPADETSIGDTSQAEESGGDNSPPEQSGDIKFRISFFDLGILLVVIIFFTAHKIREKIKHRRM